tara:strand:+ start:101 stop:253 length:153 start_codon:yes stop_codon:yes gene_type:complete
MITFIRVLASHFSIISTSEYLIRIMKPCSKSLDFNIRMEKHYHLHYYTPY